MSRKLTDPEVAHVREFLEELDALVDADDGTCFGCKHIDQLETLKEIFLMQEQDDETS